MSKQLRHLVIAVVAGTLALPAGAATIVKERRVKTTDGETSTSIMQATYDNKKFRLDVLEGDANPMLGAGGYMLMTDEAMFIVDPGKRTYIRMDMAEMAAMAQQAGEMATQQEEMQRQRGMGSEKTLKKFEFKELLDEAGPTLLGQPTRHYKYRIAYKVSETMPGAPPGMTMDKTLEREEEFWATTAFGELASDEADDALSAMSDERAGDEKFPEVAQAEDTIRSKGFRLKSVVDGNEKFSTGGAMGMMARIGSFGMMGGADNSSWHEETEVQDVRNADVPASTFELPEGYTETSMFGPGSGMPDLNQMQMPPGMGGEMPPGGMPDLNEMPEG